jgi:hypothetical protein
MQQVFNNKKKIEWPIKPSLSVSLALQCGNMAMLCIKSSKHTSPIHHVTVVGQQRLCATRNDAY